MNNQTIGQTEEAKESVEIDKLKMQTYVQEIKDNQNLSLGILGGIGAAVIGATIWAMITTLTNYQIGWMAVGVGFLVGIGVRTLGKGIDLSFGVVGAALSLLGCLAGNLLTVCILISRQENIELFNLLSRLNPSVAVELMKVTFNPMDLLFYGIAVYEGYRFSFRRISEDELSRLTK
ncbi:MAG: hypothetical protein JSV31_25435 [Desulfobacterales bacterium]|nr:MAG: hypothetical protein JSV31_25435 [Desulfobacterales bacterium]